MLHPLWRRWWIPIIVLGIIVGWVYIGSVPRERGDGGTGTDVPMGPDGQPCIGGDC